MDTARRQINYTHFSDLEGNPLGGNTYGVGFAISWQHGATREQGSDTPIRNGAFVEEIIEACINRLCFYQESKFRCFENQDAIEFLEKALKILNERTERRIARGIEGTHTV